MRWSVYEIVDGKHKPTQPTHIITSIRNYKKKSDVKSLADASSQQRMQISTPKQEPRSLSSSLMCSAWPQPPNGKLRGAWFQGEIALPLIADMAK
ncbi:MAG: hypothetical protein WB762_09190 [Candidatus Sulfotelmatobacter sp.]